MVLVHQDEIVPFCLQPLTAAVRNSDPWIDSLDDNKNINEEPIIAWLQCLAAQPFWGWGEWSPAKRHSQGTGPTLPSDYRPKRLQDRVEQKSGLKSLAWGMSVSCNDHSSCLDR